jgi:hypothetical protein
MYDQSIVRRAGPNFYLRIPVATPTSRRIEKKSNRREIRAHTAKLTPARYFVSRILKAGEENDDFFIKS